MTDDIIRMAREAGIDEPESDWMYWAAMERFAALVAAAEREACAKVAGPEDSYQDEWFKAKADSVRRIRARGNT
jgi:hypothetical protein